MLGLDEMQIVTGYWVMSPPGLKQPSPALFEFQASVWAALCSPSPMQGVTPPLPEQNKQET